LTEVLVVVAVLAVLAVVVAVGAGAVTHHTAAVACRAEGDQVRTALEASRASNARNEFPAVAGADGLDAVRVDGFLTWDASTTYWRYAVPASDSLGPTNLVRTNTTTVPTAECG
jgi:Tfp pilus assembly protein FimT